MLELRALHAYVDRLCLGRLELGLRLEYIRPRSDAACVSIVGQL